MSSKERDRFTERSKNSDLHKAKAVAMCSGGEEDMEKAGAYSSSDEQQGGDNQQSSLNRRFSAESQEFEFNKLGSDLTSPHRNEDQHHDLEGGGLASADELFYKGQLLPLQYNTRVVPAFTNSVTSSPISPWHDTIEISSSKLSLSSLREQDVQRFSSCRMDHVGLDSSLFEFKRSSSFRAHSSYYCNYYANYGPNCSTAGHWDSSTPTTSCAGETSSSSSSRDSNGSSQDSYSSSDHHKEQHICCHVHSSAASVTGPFSPFPKRKPGLMQSWKIFFTGHRRSSKPTAACRDHDQAALKSSFHGGLSARMVANPQGANDGVSKPTVLHECKLSKEKRGISERQIISKTSLLWAQEKEMGRSNGNQDIVRDDDQSPPSCNYKKDKDLTRRGSFLRGSRWQGYMTRRIKPINIIRATLVGGPSDYDHEIFPESSCSLISEQKSQPSALKGRGVPSLERRPSQPSLVSTVISGVKGPSKVSFRFDTIPSSCPASVRSSPNHSGLLVVPTPTNHSGPLITSPAFNNNMSTMQELHSAVQGAIAHCKQSISTPS